MNFINVTEEMDALNIIGQKYDIKDMILFVPLYLKKYNLDFNHHL